MLVQLFIENNEVDVSENLSALITYAIDDIKDFVARNTSFTKTIVLPGTAKNNKVFGNVFDTTVSNPYNSALPNVLLNFNAAKSARCLMFQGNIQVLKGALRLTDIIIDKGRKEYEVTIVGELGGFVLALGNKKLEDLDFSAYDQSYSITNIVNSWDNISGTGVYYPLIDYGTFSNGTYGTIKHDWQFGTFRPALYVAEYIQKMFSLVGFTYSCSLFSTTRFKSLIVPYNKKNLEQLTTQVLSAARSNSAHVLDSGTPYVVAVQMNSVIGTLFTPSNLNSRFTYNGTAPLNASFYLNGNGTYVGNATGYKIYFKVTSAAGVSTIVSGTTTTYLQTNDTTSRPYNYVSSFTLSLNQNDFVEVFVEAINPLTGTDNIIISNFLLKADSTIPTYAPVTLGDNLKMNGTIPKGILLKDFFSSILKLFHLYVYDDKFDEKKLNITPYVDFYDTNPSNADDWTFKLNRDKPIKIKPLSEHNSRYYEFKYKSDNDYYSDEYRKRFNQNYGDRIYDSQFEFAKEKTTIEIIFSSAVLVGYAGEVKIYSTIFKRSGTTEECIDSNIRILQTKKITGVASWNIMNAGTVLGSYTTYGYAGHLDSPDAPTNDLGFGAPKELYFTLVAGSLNSNQFNLYWSQYLAEITNKDSKLLTAFFRLTARDIYNLDFSKFKFIDGSMYRLNKITDYNASNEDECNIELLKVIEMTYV